jgi:hypothetical protein
LFIFFKKIKERLTRLDRTATDIEMVSIYEEEKKKIQISNSYKVEDKECFSPNNNLGGTSKLIVQTTLSAGSKKISTKIPSG